MAHAFQVFKHYGDATVRANSHGTDSDSAVKLPKATVSSPGLAVLEGGRYIVKSGTIFPANNNKALGIIDKDYDVTDGDVNATLIRHGMIVSSKLPAQPEPAAVTALKGITFVSSTELS